MVIWNGRHLIGAAPKAARRSIASWGEANGFVQIGDADVKKLDEFIPVYVIREPGDRLQKQIHTFVNRFAIIQGKTFSEQWPMSRELLEDTLAEDPKEWFTIDPVHFSTQTTAYEKYKNVKWNFVKLDNFGDWALDELYNDFILHPESANVANLYSIQQFILHTNCEQQYAEDFSLYSKI